MAAMHITCTADIDKCWVMTGLSSVHIETASGRSDMNAWQQGVCQSNVVMQATPDKHAGPLLAHATMHNVHNTTANWFSIEYSNDCGQCLLHRPGSGMIWR